MLYKFGDFLFCFDKQKFAKKIPKEQVVLDIIPLFSKLAQDEQDSVRLLTVEDLVAIAEILTKEESKTYLLQTLRSMVSDKSWRVRYMIAENFVKVYHIITILLYLLIYSCQLNAILKLLDSKSCW
jgi:hypothetical protein